MQNGYQQASSLLWILPSFLHRFQKECVVECTLFDPFVPAAFAEVPAFEFNFEKEWVLVGLFCAQASDPFRSFPIGRADIVHGGADENGRIRGRADGLIG